MGAIQEQHPQGRTFRWAVIVLPGVLATVQANAVTVIHDESIDGDLPNPVTSSLTFSLAPGTSSVIGAFTVDTQPTFTLDTDGFRMDIGSGLRLTSISIAYRFTQDPDFTGVSAILADTVTFSSLSSAMLTAGGSSPASVFSGSLGPDTFEFAGSNGAGSLDYQIDLEVTAIPIPAAVWLFGSALGLLGWMKRK